MVLSRLLASIPDSPNDPLIRLTPLVLVLVFLGPPMALASGTLYILGGSMGLENEDVWEGILADADGGPIAVLPASSSDPVDSADLIVETFDEYAPGSAVGYNVSESNPGSAEDPAIAEAIRASKGVYLTGGDQRRGARVLLRDDGTDTAVLAALRDLLAAGGVIAGSSAGAALMSDPMITGGYSDEALENGIAPDGVTVDRGLGFFPEGLTDQHFLRRGRLGRLLVATQDGPFDYGFGIEEDSALVVDLATRTARAIGAMGVVVVDATEASLRPDGTRAGFRVSYIETGDQYDFASGIVTPSADKQPITTPFFPAAEVTSPDIWDTDEVWRVMVEVMTRADTTRALGEDPRSRFDVLFHATADTAAWRGPVHSYGNQVRAYTIVGMWVHIVPAGTELIGDSFLAW